MRKSPSPPEQQEPKPAGAVLAQLEEAKPANARATRDPATALRNLLIDRLNAVTAQHDDDGRKAIEADRSIFRLMVHVKTWAAALVDACQDACHSRAAEYAEIHGDAAEGALLRALAQHLGLPTDQDLFNEPWPESNGVSEFVLEIADAPVDWTADLPAIMSYRLVRRRRLPRWQRKGPKGRATFARRPEKNTPFLSVEETEKVLRDLEESFRNVLIERSQTWFDEAELALWRSERTAEQSRAAEKTQHPSGAARMPAFRSPVKQAVADYLQWNRAASNQELRRHLNESRPNVVPDTWKDDEKLADDTFTKVRRALGIRR